jgi:endonuclease/exonuclease/phosphatase family metal-dependent hydrolase
VPAEDGLSLPCEIHEAPAAPPERDALRVVSFNVHYGRDVARIAAEISANRHTREADVLLLQEIESYPGDRRAEALAERLGMHVAYAPARAKGKGTHGLAILSRYSLRDLEILRLPAYELGWGGTRRRIAMAATLDWNGSDVRVVNVHLDTRLTKDQRFAQMRPVLASTGAHERVVIGGDVNTISCLGALLPGVPICLPGLSQGPAFDAFMVRHGFLTPFRGIGGTGPLYQRLDGIFTRGLNVTAYDKEDEIGVSDHIPVWADVSLPQQGLGALLSVPLAALPYRPTF